MITDAQIHIWGAETAERPWPPDDQLRPEREPLGADEIVEEMDLAEVDRAVLLPPAWEGDRTDLALAAVEKYPGRFGIVSRVDLHRPRTLAGFRDQPGMLGVRGLFLLPDQQMTLVDGTSEWLWAEAEEHGVPVMVCVPGQAKAILPYAERHKELRFIIDHLGFTQVVDDVAMMTEALESLFKFADLPNVAVKVTSLPCYVSDPYPFASIHPIIRQVVAAFGAERCMWGSDLSRLRGSYGDWRRAITDVADYLSPREKQLLMGASLANWLDWPED